VGDRRGEHGAGDGQNDVAGKGHGCRASQVLASGPEEKLVDVNVLRLSDREGDRANESAGIAIAS
jgi:hypothetical protein